MANYRAVRPSARSSYSTIVAAAAAAAAPAVVPGAPLLVFDAQDIAFGGAQPSDGTTFTTWKNKGSLGSGGDLTQATAGARLTFRTVGESGRIGGLSAVEALGGDWMQSAAFALKAQPLTFAFLAKLTALASPGKAVMAGGTTTILTYIADTNTAIHVDAGSDVDTGADIPNNTGKWSVVVIVCDGASSYVRVDGKQAANANVGAGGIDGFTLFATAAGTFTGVGLMAECLVYQGSATTPAQIEEYLADKYNLPTEIMFAGDSLTFGWTAVGVGNVGYRGPLQTTLPADAIWPDGQFADGVMTRNQHEGVPGIRIVDLTSGIGTEVALYGPRVVVLMIGTNDITDGDSAATCATRLATCIDTIYAASGGSVRVVLVCSPPLRDDANATADATTATYAGLVASTCTTKTAASKPCVYVGVYEGLVKAVDITPGDVHINATGYPKVAALIRTALLPYLHT